MGRVQEWKHSGIRVRVGDTPVGNTAPAVPAADDSDSPNIFTDQNVVLSRRLFTEHRLSASHDIASAAIAVGASLSRIVRDYFDARAASHSTVEENIEEFAAVFQAYVLQQPKIFTACCMQPVCFRCQC